MNEENSLATMLYDNTSDLYKSLGCTLMSEADDNEYLAKTFHDLTDQLAGAVIDASKVRDVSLMVKRVFKREYRDPNYSDTPILECVDHIVETLETKCHLTTEQLNTVRSMKICMEMELENGINDIQEAEGFNPNPYGPYADCPYDVGERNVTRTLIKLDEAVSDEEITEALVDMGRTCIAMENQFYVTESGTLSKKMVTEGSSIGKKAREISRSIKKKEAKLLSGPGGTIKQVSKAAKDAITPMEKFINNATKKIKDADKNERRNIILQGGMVPKVWRWLKRGIPLIIGGTAGTVFTPAAVATAIAFIGWVASDKYMDARERAKILKELEDEIQIVNEKIDDSRGDENKQKKYELMRIRNDLKRTQDKIKLGLRY